VRIRVGIRIRIRIAVVCGRNDGWFFNCHFNFRVATRRLPMLGQPSTSHSPSTWRKGGPGPTPSSGPFPVQELAAGPSPNHYAVPFAFSRSSYVENSILHTHDTQELFDNRSHN